MTMPAPAMSRVLPTVPRQLAVIVDRALAFDQRDRWPDALLMREAVRAFVEGAGLRLEGHVLDTAEEAKARPITLPIEGEAPQPSARPLPAAGRQVYTPGAPGVPMAEAHWRAAGAPPAIEASAGGMSLDGLMADADDGDDDAATRLRDPTVQGRAAPPSYFPRADEAAPRAYGSAPLPPSAPNPSSAMGLRGATSAPSAPNPMLAIQSSADIASHIIADERWTAAKTLSEGFERLREHGVLTAATAAGMKSAVVVRNIVAHGYSRADPAKIHAAATSGLRILEAFAAETSQWLLSRD
jgi:uncharacterized protein YutE (UPF0331/DUF86 family)